MDKSGISKLNPLFARKWICAKRGDVPKVRLSELLADNNDEVVFDRNAVVSVQPFSGE